MDSRITSLLNNIEHLEQVNRASEIAKEKLSASIDEHKKSQTKASEELDVTAHAIELLRKVSDETVQSSYKFIADNINAVLAQLFSETERRIKIVESSKGLHPQLEIELYVDGGVKRSLKDDSGHGIMQIISLLSNLCLIVINGSRRVFVLDETLSGLSAKARQMVDTILWMFVGIGFQFIVCEHGYIPKGAHVYKLAVKGKTSRIETDYIADSGTYLDLTSDSETM